MDGIRSYRSRIGCQKGNDRLLLSLKMASANQTIPYMLVGHLCYDLLAAAFAGRALSMIVDRGRHI